MGEPLVIIGNGMAAARLAEELTARSLGRYAIAVVGEEPRLAYNRVLLSSLLADDVTTAELELKSARWWRDRGVTLVYGCPAVAIETDIRRVRLANGVTLPYAKLVLATGSRPIRLPVPGANLTGVLTFRDIADVECLRRTGAGKRAVVIGGGLLGLEAAHGLAKAGAQVTLVHLMDRLMERQLDARAAAMLQAEVEARGVTVLTRAETASIEGHGHVEAVVLRDGRRLAADMVVFAIGIRPNVELARTADLAIDRGIIIDDGLATSRAGIFAIGECAEHKRICYGLVEPAYEQARVLARRLAGEDVHYARAACSRPISRYRASTYSRPATSLGRPGGEEIVLTDPGPERLQETRHRRRSPGRRGPVRRYDRRTLVSRPHPLPAPPSRRSATTSRLRPRPRRSPRNPWRPDYGGRFHPRAEALPGGLHLRPDGGACRPRRRAGRARRSPIGSRRRPHQGSGQSDRGGKEARRAGEDQARATSFPTPIRASRRRRRTTRRRSRPTISAGATTACSTWHRRRTRIYVPAAHSRTAS